MNNFMNIAQAEVDPDLYAFVQAFDAKIKSMSSAPKDFTQYWVQRDGDNRNSIGGCAVTVIMHGELVGFFRVVHAHGNTEMPKVLCIRPLVNRVHKERKPAWIRADEVYTEKFGRWFCADNVSAVRLAQKHMTLPDTMSILQSAGMWVSQASRDASRDACNRFMEKHDKFLHAMRTYANEHWHNSYQFMRESSYDENVVIHAMFNSQLIEALNDGPQKVYDIVSTMFKPAEEHADDVVYKLEKVERVNEFAPYHSKDITQKVFPAYDCYVVQTLMDNQIRVIHMNEAEKFVQAASQYGNTDANPYKNVGKHHPKSSLSQGLTFIQYFDNINTLPDYYKENVMLLESMKTDNIRENIYVPDVGIRRAGGGHYYIVKKKEGV